jgi:UrcA family protein
MSPIGRTAVRWLFSVPAVLAGVGSVADVALAGELMPSKSIRLQLTEHALDAPQGVALTYIRIRNAARSVCGYADRRFREEQEDWNVCVAATIRHTVAQIDNRKLTDFYLMRSRAPRNDSTADFRVGLRLP